MIISSETGQVLGSSESRLAGRDEESSLGLRIAIKRAIVEKGEDGW